MSKPGLCDWCGKPVPVGRDRWCSESHRWKAWDAAHPRRGRTQKSAPHVRKKVPTYRVTNMAALAAYDGGRLVSPNARRIERELAEGRCPPGVERLPETLRKGRESPPFLKG